MLVPLKGFIGPSYISRNPQFDFTRSVNLYPSLDENQTGTNQQISQLLCTPGLTNVLQDALNGAGQTSIRGLYTATNGNVFFVAGSVLYTIPAGSEAPYAPITCGSLLTTRGRVRMADNGSNLVLVDGPYGYSTDLNNPSGSFAQIVDPAFQGATFVEFYDGYFIFNKPGTVIFYWSDPNATTFDALNFASKSGNADPIAGLVVLFRQMWLIGVYTTEIWYDVGGDNTFQRLAGPYVEQGCAAPDTIAKGETGIFWLAQSLRGGVTVVRTNNNALIKISTLSVDYQLQKYGINIKRSTGLCYQKDGDLFYQVNPFNGTSSWVFDDTITALLGYPQQWHERTHTVQPEESTASVPNGVEQRHLADVSTFFNGENLVGSYKTASLYAFDTDNYTDDNGYITRTRIAPHINVNGNRIFFGLFRLGCQVGMGKLPTHACPPNTVVTMTAGERSSCTNPAIFGYNKDETTETVNTSILVNTGFGGCTFVGFATINSVLPFQGVGSVNSTALFGTTLVEIATTYNDLGDEITGFELCLRGSTSTPSQNVFTGVSYTDQAGHTATFTAATGAYTSLGDNVAQWQWFGWPEEVIPWSPVGNGWPGANTPTVTVKFSGLAVVAAPYGSVDPDTILDFGITAIENQTVSGVSQNTLLCLASTHGAPSQDAFQLMTFNDADGNQETYFPDDATFSQNAANSPPDSTWIWPAEFPEQAFSVDSAYEIDFGNTGSPCVDSPPAPTARISWSDDGGYVWSAEIPTSVGATGEYKHVVEWWRLGEGRNRAFRIRFTDPVPFNLSYAAVDVEPTDK